MLSFLVRLSSSSPKVYVNNPALTGKVASVLQAGHVLSTRFQPYESHVPFLLQVHDTTTTRCIPKLNSRFVDGEGNEREGDIGRVTLRMCEQAASLEAK